MDKLPYWRMPARRRPCEGGKARKKCALGCGRWALRGKLHCQKCQLWLAKNTSGEKKSTTEGTEGTEERGQ